MIEKRPTLKILAIPLSAFRADAWGTTIVGINKISFAKLLLGLILSAASLNYVLRDLDISALGNAFANVDYRLAFLSLLAVGLTTLAKTWRWRLLLGHAHGIPFGRALSFLIIGQMINTVFPLRFGEVERVYLAAESERVPAAVTLGSIVLEKGVDSLVLLLSLVTILPFMTMPIWVRRPTVFGGAMAIAIIIALGVGFHFTNARALVLIKLKKVVPMSVSEAVVRQSRAMLDALSEIKRPRQAPMILAWSALIWALSVATNHLALLAMGIRLPILASIFLLIVLQIGVAVPSAPGRVGIFQAATVLGLSPFMFGPTTALAYSIVLYVIIFVPISLVGSLLLWREHVKLPRRPRKHSGPRGMAVDSSASQAGGCQ